MTAVAGAPLPSALMRVWQQARRRQQIICWCVLLPPLLTLALLAFRMLGWNAATGVFATGLLLIAALATWRARRLHRTWLIRQLDRLPAARDSADLLFADDTSLNPVQQQQRARVLQALQATPPALAQRWPRWSIAASALVSVLAMALVAVWPDQRPPSDVPAASVDASGNSAAPALQSARLDITAPGYTGQPTRQQTELSAKVPMDSRLAWSLRFSSPPRSVALQFHDGQQLALHREGADWRGTWQVDRSVLYRVVTEPALSASRLHRLDAVPDQPPVVRVVAPEASLVIAQPGQSTWSLRFEASDDHGVVADAQLKVTVAEGSGENITFREQVIALRGSGSPTLRSFNHVLSLAALGAGPGNDVIVQLHVRDNHQPVAQPGLSSSLILRLPSAEQVQEAELEGMVKRTLPAYFRSQRQIIIDAEALLRQRARHDADAFTLRSDAIGVDQRILRLRYGQFLGEESEGAPKPPPTSDLPTSDVPSDDHHDDHHAHEGTDVQGGGAHAADHDHDHGRSDSTGAVFGSSENVLAEYGHTHDHAEAATLLDPQTRATLKAALDQMWLSEGALRQGRPQDALPHAYKALGFIKEVQQAERIYLARVGPELPPIDESRRLRGTRDGIASRTLPLGGLPTAGDAVLDSAWVQLQSTAGIPDLDALSQWQRSHAGRLADPLGFAAAVEELRAAPDCESCRQALRAQLWRALPRPVPQPVQRHAADAMGQRYLDALEAGR